MAGMGFGAGVITGIGERGMSKVVGDLVNDGLGFISPNDRPSAEAIISAYLHGTLDEGRAKHGLRLYGIPLLLGDDEVGAFTATGTVRTSRELWKGVYNDLKHVPGINELLVARRRQLVGAEYFKALLRRNGVVTPSVQGIYEELLKEIPGPADIVHFVLRHAFEPSTVADLGFGAEFPKSAREWFSKLGLAYQFEITDPITGQTGVTSFADMYWQSHWVPISPTQAFTMLQRLRPGRIDKIREYANGASVFTQRDVERWLRINDYAPITRPNLVAISYNVITASDARSLFQYGLNDDVELTAKMQDTGYSPTDAQELTRLEALIKQRRRAAASRGWTPDSLANGFAAGLVPADLVSRRMEAMGFTVDETQAMLDRARIDYQARFVFAGARRAVATATTQALNAYTVGTTDRDNVKTVLSGLGWSASAADAVLDAEDLAEHAKQAQRVINSIKRHFLSGRITLTEAQLALEHLGITPKRQTEYIHELNAEFTPRKKELETGKLQKLLTEGLIDATTAAVYLRNLGWSDPAALTLLAESRLIIEKHEVEALKAAERTANQQAALLQKQRNEQLAHIKKQEQAIRSNTPPGKLKQWYTRSLINDRYYTDRLLAMGYTVDAVENMLADAKIAREDYNAKREKAAAKNGAHSSPPPAGA